MNRPKLHHWSLPKKNGFRAAQLKVVRRREWLGGLFKTPSHEVPKSLRLDESKKFLFFFLVVKDLPGS